LGNWATERYRIHGEDAPDSDDRKKKPGSEEE
jgi:endogenous inhibitor of DNA gyrase (YacG/DUF329 family)